MKYKTLLGKKMKEYCKKIASEALPKEKLLSICIFFRMSNLFMSYLHILEVDARREKNAFKAWFESSEKNLCKSLLIANLFKLG
jgi:hypothetical protein